MWIGRYQIAILTGTGLEVHIDDAAIFVMIIYDFFVKKQ